MKRIVLLIVLSLATQSFLATPYKAAMPAHNQTTVRPVAEPRAIVSEVVSVKATPTPTALPVPTVVPTAIPTPVPTLLATPQPVVVRQPVQPQPVVSGNKYDWMAAAGIPQALWADVDYIITRESGWNPNAVNPTSGACGLGQQLPCGKWAHQWNDPVGGLIDATNYANARYGGWAAAHVAWIRQGNW